jgi:hypothetical protein
LTIKIGDYNFAGPFDSTHSIEDKSGIYAIINYKEGKYYLLDVGESAQMKKTIEEQDREEWKKHSESAIMYSVRYTPDLKEDERKEIEAKIRATYIPPYGKS